MAATLLDLHCLDLPGAVQEICAVTGHKHNVKAAGKALKGFERCLTLWKNHGLLAIVTL